MSNFDAAVALVFEHEKGYVDDPLDAGGPTNFGITIATLSAYFGHAATPDDVKNLMPETARAVYRKLFWDRFGLEAISSPALAVVLFDQTVLCGAHTAIGRLQTALETVAVTGTLGPQTLAACASANTNQLILSFLRASAKAHIENVKKRPAQIRFLGGWIDRLFSLEVFVSKRY